MSRRSRSATCPHRSCPKSEDPLVYLKSVLQGNREHRERAPHYSLVACVVAGLSACSGSSPTGSLFPLEPDRRWVYEVRSQWENRIEERQTRTIVTRGEAEVPQGGKAWVRRSEDGVEWYLRADDSGVFRVATRTDLQAEPEADPSPRYVLKAPIAAGTSWQTPTAPYLLRRRADFPPEIRHSHPSVNMVFTIESLEEKVQTPAGSFEPCVKVVGQASLRLFADPVAGWRDMPLITTEWYCKGPGLVKVVRTEPAESAFLIGGTMTLELIEWK